MKKMMLYEAFQSNILTSLNKFLTKKITKKQSTEFISRLKNVMSDIPINPFFRDIFSKSFDANGEISPSAEIN